MPEDITTESKNRIAEKLMFAKNGDIKNMQIGPFEYEFWDNGLTEKQACEVGEFIKNNDAETILSPFDFISDCLIANRILFRLKHVRRPIGFSMNRKMKHVVKTINKNMEYIARNAIEMERIKRDVKHEIIEEAKKQGLIKDET